MDMIMANCKKIGLIWVVKIWVLGHGLVDHGLSLPRPSFQASIIMV